MWGEELVGTTILVVMNLEVPLLLQSDQSVSLLDWLPLNLQSNTLRNAIQGPMHTI